MILAAEQVEMWGNDQAAAPLGVGARSSLMCNFFRRKAAHVH
jgi:hypothetical protein